VTYAFSIYRVGRNAEALEVIQGLPVDQLHDPHAAVYAALLLVGAGQIDAARDYVAAADDEIYPEEKVVLDEAKAKIASTSAASSPAVSPVPAQPSPTPAASPR
jgi:hypothetical protein